MATKVVLYISENCLPCSCKGTVNVILCTIYGQTVPGQIIESSATADCESGEWKYQISYDSDDLPEGVTALATTDITSVACKGCLATWVEELIASVSAQAVVIKASEDVYDFAGRASGSTSTLTLIVTNPSDTLSLKGKIDWAWNLNVQANAEYDATISSELNADSVAINDSSGNLNFSDEVPGGIIQQIAGTSGCVPYDIDPGDTVVITMDLTSAFTNEPNIGFVVAYPQMTYSGVTVPA